MYKLKMKILGAIYDSQVVPYIMVATEAIAVVVFLVMGYKFGQVRPASGKLAYIMLAVLLAIITPLTINTFKKAKKERDEAAARRRAEKEFTEKALRGEWSFPAEEFCEQCRSAGVLNLDSEYYRAKAKAIAEQILSKTSVHFASFPKEAFPLYTSVEKMSEYFAIGKAAEEQEEKRQEEEKKLSWQATLTDEQKKEMDFHKELKEMTGTEKRKAMLSKIIIARRVRKSELEKAQEAMRTLGFAIASSAAEEKTTSWATVAGIADGLAGPVAGALAGAETMQRNAAVEARNQQNREAVGRTAVGIIKGSTSLYGDISSLESDIRSLSKEEDALRTKVVLGGTDVMELYDSLIITEICVKKSGEALTVSAKMQSTYKPEGIPEHVRMTVDGTLTGRVMAGDLFVGTVCLPLPMYGVECGAPTATVAETICDHYAKNDKPYTVTFTPNNLWVMEL